MLSGSTLGVGDTQDEGVMSKIDDTYKGESEEQTAQSKSPAKKDLSSTIKSLFDRR
jgi:hypothetical protein